MKNSTSKNTIVKFQNIKDKYFQKEQISHK